MAFDACFMAAIAAELNNKILGARVEKVQQPEKDEIVLTLHVGRDTHRLSISAGASCPRINLTGILKENPASPPMFCMLLRKHLVGGRITAIKQLGFERAIELEFESNDELGYESKKYLIAEIMGKYSNLIFCNGDKKIVSAIKIVDFTTSQKRQVLPGMTYELPPKQDKMSPLDVDEDSFDALFEKHSALPIEKFITTAFSGIATVTARELAYKSGGAGGIKREFFELKRRLTEGDFEPIMLRRADDLSPLEYSFMPITHYGEMAINEKKGSFGELIDSYFGEKEKAERIKQRGNDILRLLTNIESRLLKKLELQKSDLAECATKETQKLYGDLITANIYRLKRGMESVSLENYYSESLESVDIALDSRLTPAQNAQKYYKKYAKLKAAEKEIAHQMAIAQSELEYIYTVFDAAARAENESDLNEIRRELYESGYASRMKDYTRSINDKKKAVKPMTLYTDNGFRLLIGKNNSQNDYITTKLAEKWDIWFHVKGAPGSHCLLVTDGVSLDDIPDIDITRAAECAAYYSSLKGSVNVGVDYLIAKNLRKPSGSKPGFVTYSTNWTAYVTPDERVILGLKKN